MGADDEAYHCIFQQEDSDGIKGVKLDRVSAGVDHVAVADGGGCPLLASPFCPPLGGLKGALSEDMLHHLQRVRPLPAMSALGTHPA